MEYTLQSYRDFRPTGCDPAGLGLDDRQDWLVAPVTRNRDSEVTARSNFRVVLKDLGGEGDNVEIARFGHWACGWFEVLLVRPGTEAADKADDWAGALESYPIACESDHSELEWEEKSRYWEHCGMRERMGLCVRAGLPFVAARHDYIPGDVDQYI